MFLKECRYIEKKVIRHINDNLSDFSYSDDPDEEKIRIITFFEIVSKNTVHYFSNGECTQKKRVVFLKPCLQSIKIQKTIK